MLDITYIKLLYGKNGITFGPSQYRTVTLDINAQYNIRKTIVWTKINGITKSVFQLAIFQN